MAEPTPEVTDTTTAPPEPTPTASEAEKQYGSSSYHYWHAHGKEREALGDVAPMPQARLVATEAPAEKSRRVVAISKYSWSDGKKIVSVYIDLKGIGALQDKVTVSNKKRSVTLKVEHDEHDEVLKLVRLNQVISGTSLKFKDDQLVLKLSKAEENKWYDLQKTTMRGATGSDSDE